MISTCFRFNLLQNIDQPSYDFVYPLVEEHGKKKHSFQQTWPKKYSWLCYSKHCNGGFCAPCLLLATGDTVGALVSWPLTKFYKATTLLKDHESCQYHRHALVALAEFTARMKQIRLPVIQEAQTAVAKRVCKNRSILRSIVKTIVLLGEQNIPFRGNRDDSKWIAETGHNPGNFQALLDFRLDWRQRTTRTLHVCAKERAISIKNNPE